MQLGQTSTEKYQNGVTQVGVSFLRSIQGQVMSWTILLALIPALIVGFMAYATARSALRSSAQENLLAVSEIKAQRVESLLQRWVGITDVISQMPAIAGQPGAESVTGISMLANSSIAMRNTSGYERIVNEINVTLRALENVFPGIEVAYLISTEGEIIVSTNPALFTVGDNVSDLRLFQMGLTEPHISDIHRNPVNEDQLLYAVSAPIQVSDGSVVGVAGVKVSTDTLETIMADGTALGEASQQYLGETGESYIVNQPNETYGQVMLTQSTLTSEETRLLQIVDTHATQQVFSGGEGEVVLGTYDYIDYRGVNVVGAWRYIPDLNWALIAEIDTAEAYAAVDNLAVIVGVVVALAAFAAACIAFIVSRSISRPVAQLAHTARRLANGNLEERAKITSRNEVGELAVSFNSMAENLEAMVKSERLSKTALENTVIDYMTFVEEVSAGNLTARLRINSNGNGNGNGHHHEEDEDLNRLGVNLNNMVENLADMAQQVRAVAQSVSTSATEIQAAATQQAASATEQDSAVTQTVATVEEVRSTVVQTAERAQTVAESAQQSVNVSVTGQRAVDETMQGMDELRVRVENIAETILTLSERTQQIGEIINTVNALADQSKLLALNASIEAARAGEEGKGFAVVAMEVRQLAEQSRDATSRVRDILSEIQQVTNTAVMVTEEGSKGAESGLFLVQYAGESIRELTGTIEEAAQSATQIAASTHQQTSGMDQLASAMMQIKQSTTQTASTMKQTEQSVRDLMELSRQLEDVAARYQL